MGISPSSGLQSTGMEGDGGFHVHPRRSLTGSPAAVKHLLGNRAQSGWLPSVPEVSTGRILRGCRLTLWVRSLSVCLWKLSI